MSDEEDATDEAVFERERPIEAVRDSSAGPGIGIESIKSWASLNVSERKDLGSPIGKLANSIGDSVFKASWRAAIVFQQFGSVPRRGCDRYEGPGAV